MGTADGTPKKNLVMTEAAMPKPLNYEPGRFKVDGVLLPDPHDWHTLSAGNKEPSRFDIKVAPQSIDDFVGRKRSRNERS